VVNLSFRTAAAAVVVSVHTAGSHPTAGCTIERHLLLLVLLIVVVVVVVVTVVMVDKVVVRSRYCNRVVAGSHFCLFNLTFLRIFRENVETQNSGTS